MDDEDRIADDRQSQGDLHGDENGACLVALERGEYGLDL
jgi:hypothetical protein